MRGLKNRLQQTAVDWFALPPDTVTGVPRITCINGKEVVIENVKALRHVSADTVVVETAEFIAYVEGQGFEVTLLTDKEVHMQGDVRAVRLEKGGARS